MAYIISAEKTPGGYVFGECISALQKMIRRADEEQAMYWAIEIVTWWPSNLWNRLEIIAHEDIGIANPNLVVAIATWKMQYKEMRARKNDAYRLVLANAILSLCRSPKTRIADNFVHTTYRETAKFEIPDVALDKHTYAGKRMGRSWDHFFTEGIKLEGDQPIEDIYKKDAELLIRADVLLKDQLPEYAPKPKKKTKAQNMVDPVIDDRMDELKEVNYNQSMALFPNPRMMDNLR